MYTLTEDYHFVTTWINSKYIMLSKSAKSDYIVLLVCGIYTKLNSQKWGSE